MISDDLKHVVPRKRSRSASPSPPLSRAMTPPSEEGRYQRQPKRQRRNKDVPEYDALPDEHALKLMERSNPLSRRVLKKEAKKARKAHRVRAGAGAGMEVDNDTGLQFTFMA